MPNWCSNRFYLRNLTAAQVTALKTEWKARQNGADINVLVEVFKTEDGFRNDGDWHFIIDENQGTAVGFIGSAWGPPEDFIDELAQTGHLATWRYYEGGFPALGFFEVNDEADEDGHYWCDHTEAEYSDPEQFLAIMRRGHPDYEHGEICLAQPGELVADLTHVFGLCVRRGHVQPFGGQSQPMGHAYSDGRWVMQEDEMDPDNWENTHEQDKNNPVEPNLIPVQVIRQRAMQFAKELADLVQLPDDEQDQERKTFLITQMGELADLMPDPFGDDDGKP